MLRSSLNSINQHSSIHWYEKFCLKKLLKLLNNTQYGVISVSYGGNTYHIEGKQTGPSANITINNLTKLLILLMRKSDIGFAEGYIEGYWTTTHLTNCLLFFATNEPYFKSSILMAVWNRLKNKWLHFRARNSLLGSKQNIQFHYDLGNEFYQLWLDKTMTYSSGIYQKPTDTLIQAQRNKYQRIYQQLNPKPEETILEIGCGWGGFAAYATEQGSKVLGITLSNEQLHYCQQRFSSQANSAAVNFKRLDYRHLNNTYSYIASIEMFEAVGEQYWHIYFAKLASCLKSGGTAVLQIITINEVFFESYRNRPDFIQLYIFPGGMLPTRSKVISLAEQHNLQVSNLISIGESYRRTLQDWLVNFNNCQEALEGMGFNKKFRKTWQYYLAYCIAGFLCNRIDTIQVTLHKPDKPD
ncbi:SAM-dependent methyltransferase [Spartinivicinus poritis]|uniref:Cyclopropane-fatty-acyl-phospholipid synthase n=1 Tax=Spartinivicinus poritis TaxID=2994640 RepID=A0ABT5UHF0_9GAMM|nr:cyclopropane-fatty-acyl-phospholipid synthase family protein [Spartinivicinus sp. A2-2]MDE1465788.1 cyclopropane-fatty-acyl-phospholipid synthase [Spartinivicinus sp. A2-2]